MALETGQIDLAMETFASDAVLNSPLTNQLRFEGREELRDLLEVAFEAFEDVRFHTVVGEGPTWALFYTARIGNQDFEEAQLMRLNEQGKIVEATLMIRPLPAQTALMDAIGPQLARRFGLSRVMAALMPMMVKPLAFLARLVDRRGVSLLKPHRDGER
jgi:hypothetical protein